MNGNTYNEDCMFTVVEKGVHHVKYLPRASFCCGMEAYKKLRSANSQHNSKV